MPKYKFFQKNVSPVSSVASEEIEFLQTLDPSMSELLDQNLKLVNKRLVEQKAVSDSKISDEEKKMQESRERVLAMWSSHNST